MAVPPNKKMQQTSRGQNGGSLLILVFDGRDAWIGSH